MTTTLNIVTVPVTYYTALDPYNWKVDNRPLQDLEDNQSAIKASVESSIETALNAVKTGAAVDGRLLRALVGDDKASGNWTLHPSAASITITDSIKVKTTTDDGFDVGVIAAQYAPAVFALAIPAAGLKNLVTISARYKLPNSADMPYYDSTQGLDGLAVSLATAQTKQGTMEFAIATSTVAVGAPDNYFVHGSGYDALFHIKILETDTVLNPSRVLAVGITKLGQSVARATNATYGQVRFATGTEVTAGTSTDTVVSPADLNTRALLGGDPLVKFQVEDAVDQKDAINLQTGDSRYLQYLNTGQPSEVLTIRYGIGNFKAVSGNVPVVYTYTTDYRFISMELSVFSGGGGGGAAGGTGNNPSNDLGSAGGAGGGSGCGVRTTLTSLRPGTIITIELGAAGTGGAYAYNPGNPGVPSAPSFLTVEDPDDGRLVRVVLPGGLGGSGSLKGGINSCTAPGGTAAVVPQVQTGTFFPMSLVSGGVGEQGYCSGGQSGGAAGKGGVLTQPYIQNGITPAIGGAPGSPGLPGGDAFISQDFPFSLANGGGGGGGANAGQSTGGAGGDPAPAGYIIRLKTRNYE